MFQQGVDEKHADSFVLGDAEMECSRTLIGPSTSIPLFQTIPPERVGLQGEYDHQGLAKRVLREFRQHIGAAAISELRVAQRGAVVMLIGKIPTQRLLIKLVNLAMSVSGTADVEVNGISAGYSLRSYLEVKPSSDTLARLQKLLRC